jgi:cap1 methyltransferase
LPSFYFEVIINQRSLIFFLSQPQQTIQDMLGLQGIDCIKFTPNLLTPENMGICIQSVFDWKCFLTGAPTPVDVTFFLGMGQNKNFQLNLTTSQWVRVNDNIKFDLPAKTLIYAEIVQECHGEGKGMQKLFALHIIEAVYLAGEDLRSIYSLKTRYEMLQAFVKSMNKSNLSVNVIMRVKDIVGLEQLEQQLMSRLTIRILKGSAIPKMTMEGECEITTSKYVFVPTGLLMMPIVKEPFMMAFSKSQQCPPGAKVDFKTSFKRRYK